MHIRMNRSRRGFFDDGVVLPCLVVGLIVAALIVGGCERWNRSRDIKTGIPVGPLTCTVIDSWHDGDEDVFRVDVGDGVIQDIRLPDYVALPRDGSVVEFSWLRGGRTGNVYNAKVEVVESPVIVGDKLIRGAIDIWTKRVGTEKRDGGDK